MFDSSRTRRACAIAIGALVLVGCGSSSDGGDVTGRAWQLTELQGSPIVEGTVVDMTVDADGVSGSSGCNSYFGSATFADGTVSVAPELAGTMMACEEPIMTQEQAFLAMLLEAETYEVSGDELSLFDGSGAVVASFG